MNLVGLIGRLVKDPELRYLTTGTAVCNFTLAVDKKLARAKKEEMEKEGKPTADFFRVTVWGKMGETTAEYMKKGSKLALNGRLQSDSYADNDGKKVYTVSVVAEGVEFLGKPSGNAESEQSSSPQDYGIGNVVEEDEVPF